MPSTYVQLLYHIVFSTKNHQPTIDPKIETRLIKYIGGIVRENRGKLLAANTVPDHIHLYLSMRTEPSIAAMLRLIKTNSSKWIHETFPNMKEFRWQRGYGAFSVSKSVEPRVIQYIKNQKEHHRKKTFQEEFIQFLEQYDIEYDERYIWE